MYFLYISPTYGDIMALSAKKAEYDAVILQSKQLISERDAILTKYNSIPQEDIDRLNKVIPSTFDPVVFLNNLNTMAGTDGIQIKDVKINQVNPDSRDTTASTATNAPYVTSDLLVTLGGSYPQFVQFMQDLESSLDLIDVVNLTILPTVEVQTVGVGAFAQKVTSIKLQYTLDLHTYSLK